MRVVICPGIHAPELTVAFLDSLGWQANCGDRADDCLIVPTACPPYSAWHVFQFLRDRLRPQSRYSRPGVPFPGLESLVFISFSAGVVGAIGATHLWRCGGGPIAAFIAVDGWGVPLYGSFPIYRISHDPFTHWSSGLLGRGQAGFYAEPAVSHLELWRSPQIVWGWQVRRLGQGLIERSRTTAAQFIRSRLSAVE